VSTQGGIHQRGEGGGDTPRGSVHPTLTEGVYLAGVVSLYLEGTERGGRCGWCGGAGDVHPGAGVSHVGDDPGVTGTTEVMPYPCISTPAGHGATSRPSASGPASYRRCQSCACPWECRAKASLRVSRRPFVHPSVY
jgi:hypothetical protein